MLQNSAIAFLITVVALAILMTIVNVIFELECVQSNLPSANAWMLVVHSIVMCTLFGACSFYVFQQRYGIADFDRWFNGMLPKESGDAVMMILVGMVSYFVFGFLDNAGLFFGSN